jgi:hypothetical protein
MKPVLRTTDRSLIESVRLALEAEGIAVVLGQELGAIPFIPVAVLVAESDLDRARQIIRDLAPPLTVVKDDQPSPRLWRVAFIVVVILIIILFGRIFIR